MLDHKLIVFYHLAKNPNTTKVAEILYLSQPAISKNIKELEKELNISLFDRKKGRLHLTGAGEFLLQKTEQLIREERDVLFEINKMIQAFSGTLNIGASTTLSQYILPELLAKFTSNFPDIKINVISGNTSQIEEEIMSNNLHLAFIEGTPNQPDIHYIPFIKDEIVLVCSTRTEIGDCISKEQLQQLNFVFREKGSGTYNIIKKQLDHIGIDINSLHQQLILGSTEGIKRYLQHSDCFALVSAYGVRDELSNNQLKIIDIEDLSIERMFYAIHKQGTPDAYAAQFLQFIFSKHKLNL